MGFKEKLLSHLWAQDNMGAGLSGICFSKHNFCPKIFSKLVNRSEFLVKKVIKDKHVGVRRYIHGNSGRPKDSMASISFVVWMLLFISKFGQDSPEDLVKVLPSYMYKGHLFKLYRDQANPPLLARSSFYLSMKKKFGPRKGVDIYSLLSQ